MLQNLLSMPEIEFHVANSHFSKTDTFYDICDGVSFRSSNIFKQNPNALQIILYMDDIEVVNPIGVHTKKAQVMHVLFTLANIPPQFRSKLSSIYLLAIARSNDLKEYGVDTILKDFF